MGNVYITRTCAMCGKIYRGHIRSKYCDACRVEAQRQARHRYRVQKRAGEVRPLGSVDQCTHCGKDYIVNGGLQRYCPECAPVVVKDHDNAQGRARDNLEAVAAAKQRAKERPKETYTSVCPTCSKVFDHTDRRRKYCSSECRHTSVRERDRLRKRR